MKLSLTIALIIISLLASKLNSSAQSLPVGTPGLEEYYRRAQLMGQLDSTISFCARPMYPTSALTEKDPFNPSTLNSQLSTSHLPIFSSSHRPLAPSFTLLPITWKQQWNSHHPYSLNDGALIPARGYQSMLSTGFSFKLGPLSVQLCPEFVYAENRHFDSFTDIPHSNQAVNAYNGFHSVIDFPEYFPERPYNRLFPGQSSVRLTFGAVSAGISSENLWWGPGTRNAIMMSNSAPGFYHLTLNTVRPVRTPIGSIEGQIIGGKLETSDFLGFDQQGKRMYYPNSNDWRYLNAMVLSYQPRWVHGLFIGLTRSFMMMGKDAKKYNRYLRVFSPVSKRENYGESESAYVEDQQLTLFARWIFPADHAEFYGEYGRGDHNYDLRDMYLQPDHSRAYLIGFKKLFYHDDATGKYVQFDIELTQMEQNNSNTDRAVNYFASYGAPLRGNTNQGQMLGASIGPGSNLQTITLSWGQGLNNVGFQLERYVHNNDLYYQFSKDPRGHWVDINVAFNGQYSWKSFLFSGKLEGIRSFNYEYSYVPRPTTANNYWAPGEDIYNLQGNLSVMYRF